jgi:microcystin-dependent protein
MSEPFLADVKIFGFNFAPRGYAMCDGQLLPIAQNQALYSLLGTTYGGDGRTTFALPDLRGRVAIHVDTSHPQGQQGGEEGHTLSVQEMPNHAHGAQATSQTPAGTTQGGNLLAPTGGGRRPITPYGSPGNLTPLVSGSVANQGGGQAHENMQPYQVLNFCIALQGYFPSRN